MASSLKRILDTPGRIRFAQPQLGGWILALVGLGFSVASITVVDEAPVRWISFGVGTLFFLLGIWAAFYRFELELDLAGGRYRFRRGMAWSPEEGGGSLDHLTEIRLRQDWERRGSGSKRRDVATWEVHLAFESAPGRVKVTDLRDEEEAVRVAEELARRLGRPLLDQTGKEPRRIAPDSLDAPLDQDPGRGPESRPARWTEPDPSSGIDVVVDAGHRTVLLPRQGFGLAFWIVFLFAASFAGMGGGAVLAGFGYLPSDDSPLTLWLVGGAFFAFGFALMIGVVIGAASRAWVRDEGSRLVFGRSGLGTTYRVRHLPKHLIEDVSVVESSASRRPNRGGVTVGGVRVGIAGRGRAGERATPTEVRVRSDDEIVRLGQSLDPENQLWLEAALRSMLT